MAKHGGKQLEKIGGSLNPNIKHGFTARNFPAHLAERIEARKNDPDLITLTDETAILDVFVDDQLADINKDNCQAAWDSLEALLRLEPDKEEQSYWIMQAKGVIRDGVEEWRKVTRVLGYIEQKRKLAETASRIKKDRQLFIDLAEIDVLVTSLGFAIQDVFEEEMRNDPTKGERIFSRLQEILDRKSARKAYAEAAEN